MLDRANYLPKTVVNGSLLLLHYCHDDDPPSQKLSGNLLPTLAVHVVIDEGLGHRTHTQLGKLPFYH
jgi:hypothetical protein